MTGQERTLDHLETGITDSCELRDLDAVNRTWSSVTAAIALDHRAISSSTSAGGEVSTLPPIPSLSRIFLVTAA